MPEFCMIFDGKINKIPEFYMIFARKICFPEFWGTSAPCPPFPTPMYSWLTLLVYCQFWFTEKCRTGKCTTKTHLIDIT